MFFKPRDIKSITPFETYSSTYAGLYSQKQINEFWENIVTHKKGEGILKILTSKLAPQSEDTSIQQSSSLYWKDADVSGHIYVDKLISPEYFKNSFMTTFGTIAYYLTAAGSWFATFMFIRFIIGIVITVCRTYHLHSVTARSITWTRVILDGILNTMTAVVSGKEQYEDNQPKKRPIFKSSNPLKDEILNTDKQKAHLPPDAPKYLVNRLSNLHGSRS